jgi:transposase-like protein
MAPKEYFYFRHMGNQPNEEKRQIAAMLYNSGMSLRECAERMGITFQAVYGLLKRHGVTLRGRGGNLGAHSRRKK